ncbi:MAG: hypothetical protein EBY49_10735, partial [Actinobacteria bacterium]|nr:hypothetical protein [Actinomycetota bacterium]
ILAAAARVLDIEPQPAARPPGDEPSVRRLDAEGEAVAIARSVRGRHKPGAPWRHQAVLARTNAQLPAVRTALERAGIPVRSRGDGALLRRPEVMELIDTWHGDQSLSDVLADATTELPDSLDGAHLSEERRAMLQAFLDIARGHLELERRATVDDFLSSLRTDDRVSAVTDGVELGTFHSAKGLEWPIVHLVGIEDGYVPIGFAQSADARAEERRLLYVAATRAERELHVSWSDARVIGDQLVEREPSPWIEAFRGEPDPLPDERPSIANLRAKIAAVPEVDLFTQLQDSANAIGWAKEKITNYGGDPSRLHLIGHSAGAHHVAILSTNHRFLEKAGVSLGDLRSVVELDTQALDVPAMMEESENEVYRQAFGSESARW